MTTNGTAKWIGGLLAVITLCFGIVGIMYAGALKRIELNEVDVRRMDKNQVLIMYQLEDINDKLDKLLEKRVDKK